MKKAFAFIALSLAAAIASAYPAVKDKASFNGIYSAAAGGSIEFQQTIELVSFNRATNKFTMKADVTVNGRSQSQAQEVDASELLTSQKVAEIMGSCSQIGGRLETLKVPAGTFATCAIPLERSGMIWIADIAFGFAKQDYIDEEGNRTIVESTGFVNGN